jgi:hypothetical protein
VVLLHTLALHMKTAAGREVQMWRSSSVIFLLLFALSVHSQETNCSTCTLSFDRFVVDYRTANWCTTNRLAAEFVVTNNSGRTQALAFSTELDECLLLEQRDSIFSYCPKDPSLRIHWLADNGFNEVMLYPHSSTRLRVVASIAFDSSAYDVDHIRALFEGECQFVFSSFLWDVDGTLCPVPRAVLCPKKDPLILSNGVALSKRE